MPDDLVARLLTCADGNGLIVDRLLREAATEIERLQGQSETRKGFALGNADAADGFRTERDEARATIDRVKALADEWRARYPHLAEFKALTHREAAAELLAALSPAPTEKEG
ncbi:MAG: hypothetical protein WC718_15265 [Phycisphaerales bacterium]|jgi:hypothetical protein